MRKSKLSVVHFKVILLLANSIKVVIQSARSLTLSVSRQKVNVSPVRLVPDRDAAAVASRDGELVVEVDAAGLWRVRWKNSDAGSNFFIGGLFY